MSAFGSIFRLSVLQLVRRPLYWVGFFLLPFFCFLMLSSEMEEGLPVKAPAAMVDKDGSALARNLSNQLGTMQMVDLKYTCNSYTEARHLMQEGKIYGYFLIPEDFEQDLMSGKAPIITFYTNMTYFVPASLLFKSFKTTALYTKAGVVLGVAEAVGASEGAVASLLQPVNITVRGLGNPEMNYGVYLGNSFIPAVLELMIFLITCFSLGQEIKYGSSVRLMKMAKGSILRALAGKLLPQTLIWWIVAIFMESWLFGWSGYPVYGSLFWLTISELMFVLACQGLAVFFFCILPSLRLSLSISALLGILAFSLGCFSFPYESMYGAIGIFSWIYPVRYNFLIYINEALNGLPLYYSRWWFVAYIGFMLLPLTMLWRLKKEFLKPVYTP